MLQYRLHEVVCTLGGLFYDIPLELFVIWWVGVLCDFERSTRKPWFGPIALEDVLLARAQLLPDPREASLQWLANPVQVAIFECSEALLNLLRVPLGSIEVDPIHLNKRNPP